MNKKYLIITIICFVISLISGILSNDIIIGGANLFTALLCAYFSCEGKRISYILGLINHLYGLFIFGVIIMPNISNSRIHKLE